MKKTNRINSRDSDLLDPYEDKLRLEKLDPYESLIQFYILQKKK